MTVSFELPREIEKSLREELGDLDRTAKETLLVELYRQEKIAHQQLAGTLGLGRFETDAVLKRHEVYYDLSAEDVARESDGLRRLRDKDADRR
jgi:hypothetical protein